MLSIWRSPRHESNAIEAQQTGFRSDPQISIRSLCNRIRRATKDSVLNPPGGMCVLGDMAGRIHRPHRGHWAERKKKAEKKKTRNGAPLFPLRRAFTALFSRAHRQPPAPSSPEKTQ